MSTLPNNNDDSIIRRLTTAVVGLIQGNEDDEEEPRRVSSGLNIVRKLSYNIQTGRRETTIIGGALLNQGNRLSQQAYETVMISVVIAHNKDKFCTTDEESGWYLPAGRLKYGESCINAAKRLCMGEAGIDINVEGILRIEYSFKNKFVRLRFILDGVPADENASLKTIPDDASIGAEWLTYKEVQKISKKGRNNRKLRDREVLDMLKWSSSGTAKFPMDLLLDDQDGRIDTSEDVTNVYYTSQVLIKCGNRFLVSRKWQLPHEGLKILVPLEDIALDVLVEMNKEVLGEMGKLTGICGINYSPPTTFKLTATGKFCITYLATVSEECLDLKEKVKKDWQWVTLSDYNIMVQHGTKKNMEHVHTVGRLIKNVCDEKVAPLEFFSLEANPYTKLNASSFD